MALKTMVVGKQRSATRLEVDARGGIIKRNRNQTLIQAQFLQRAATLLMVTKTKKPRKFGADQKPRNRLQKKRRKKRSRRKKRRLLNTNARKKKGKKQRRFLVRLNRQQQVLI